MFTIILSLLVGIGAAFFVGFAFWQWLPLVLAMIASGAIGTWLGLKLLNRIPADKFRLLFKIILTVLALRLLYQALASVF